MLNSKVKPEEIKNILIIRDDHLGDLICSLPTVVAIRKHFPNSRITILVSEPCEEIVENHAAVDSFLIRIKKKSGVFCGIINFWKRLMLLNDIRSRKFDLVIALRSRFCPRHAWMAGLSGARYRVGHKSPRLKHFLHNLAYNISPANYNPEQHELMRTYDIVRILGVPLTDVTFDIRTTPDQDSLIEAFLKTHGISDGKPMVCYHLSASKPKKQWPPERMISLINIVQSRYPQVVNVVTYDPFNFEHRDFLQRYAKDDILVFESREFMQLAALYRKSKIVISLDGAPMHLSAALGIPTLGIFEAENTLYWEPWGEGNISISGKGELESLSPEAVFNKLEILIRKHISDISG